MRRAALAAMIAALACATTAAQEGASDIGRRLLQEPAVIAALEAAKLDEPRTIEEQVEICEVSAPPFGEKRRGELYAKKFRELGLTNVRIDRVGNVLGERPGTARRPHLVFSAHLDTVFPEETSVKTTREGSLIRGPGINDDCRGLAVVLAVIRALDAGKVRTPGTITFVGTVGEEGLGDLRGVKHLFNEELKGQIDRFVSIDGAGFGITRTAVGSHRYKVSFKGRGGHSFGAFGLANPVHALGRLIGKIADFQVPAQPKTTFNVGRIGGGTSVNSIPFEAWMEIDMRSADPDSLEAVHTAFNNAVDQALAEENARWQNKGAISVVKELVGTRPAGSTPADAPVLLAALSVNTALGLPARTGEGSTDSNIPISMGIPAVTIGGGGGPKGGGSHSLDETFDTTDSWKGSQRATLLAIALSQP
jgi:acetylornithine deacetylase/succinyl-diaminopimelate desuccinylase-like protein